MELQTYSRNYGYSKWALPNYYPQIHHLQKKGLKKIHIFFGGWKWKASSPSTLISPSTTLPTNPSLPPLRNSRNQQLKEATFNKTNPEMKIQNHISPRTANQRQREQHKLHFIKTKKKHKKKKKEKKQSLHQANKTQLISRKTHHYKAE